jgi:isopenicillin N synthase-like dioxygenase
VTLAVVDLSSDAVIDRVRRACEETGFLIVTGHSIDPGLVKEIDEVSRLFFNLPLEEKLRLRDGELKPDRPIYRPVKSESLGATSGDRRRGDLKESLDYGPTLPGAGWPAHPPGLENAYRRYLAAMNELGARLRRCVPARCDTTTTSSSRCSTIGRRVFASSTTRSSSRGLKRISSVQALTATTAF